jgi:excisionase family DNA binding protein
MSKEKLLKFLTVEQLAERWGVSKSHIYNRLSAKTFEIKPVRFGRLVRFRLEDVEEYEATL